MAKDTTEQQQNAKDLYLLGWSQNRIANALGVSDNAVSRWKQKGKWDELRRQSISEETEVNNRIRKIFNAQTKVLDTWVDDNPDKLLDKGVPDGLYKIYSMIKTKNTTWPQLVETIAEFMDFVSGKDSQLAKQLLEISDEFVLEKKKAINP